MKKKKIILKAVILLVVVYLTIGFDLIVRFSHDDSLVIDENVEFGSFSSDVTNSFIIADDETLDLETYIECEDGMVCISIINPNNEVVYENRNSSSEAERVELTVWKGEWKYRVKCEDASNGKYTIQCKRKD